jgi:hypothetical protein
VGELRFHPADRAQRERGLIGWTTFELGSVRVDGVAVRRTRDGRLTLSFPTRVDDRGRLRAVVRPRSREAHEEIVAQVIAEIRRMGYVA